MPSQEEILNQLRRLRQTGFAAKLEEHGTAHNLPTPFFFAIASRETNCRNILGDPQGGEFHGVGIIQIDIQHPIAREARDSGSFKTNPDPLIEFGAQLLEDNINQAKQNFPDFDDEEQLKVAASGYNCGMPRAIKGALEGDSDKRTTQHNYGRDVITRMGVFAALIAAGN